MTTKKQIDEWIDKSKTNGADYLMVVCDTYDWEDYPVEIYPKGKKKYSYDFDDLENAVKHFSINMNKIMEVYNVHIDKHYEIQGSFNKLVRDDLKGQ